MSENNHRPCFHREDGVLFCEGVSLLELSCRLEQTTYVYSRARIERNSLAYEEALADVPHAICYAMKANSTAGVLQVLARLGAGVDTVSGGEIARALGRPHSSKAVGYALHSNPDHDNIPCHRVVNRFGEPSDAFAFGGKNMQIEMLKAEGVKFKNGTVDLSVYCYFFD